MGGSYYPISCSIISTGKDRKTLQRYPDVPATSWRIFIRSMDSFQGLIPKNFLIMALIVGFKSKFFLIMSPFILSLTPQPQALGTTFEARVRDYMVAHTERMERFENPIFNQREKINGKMTEMFRLLKELTTNKTPEKVLIREEAKFPVTKNVNSISLARDEEEENNKMDETPDNTKMPIETEMLVRKAEAINELRMGPEMSQLKHLRMMKQ
ncbi:hypothetical protein Tco_0475052 [Tanacetum coccineum]